MSVALTAGIAAVVLVSFALSAAAGMGGSLLLVPAMAAVFGAKLGIATAALLLACNNVGKVYAYRKHVPLKASAALIVLTVTGAFLGASLLVRAPDHWVAIAVVVVIAGSYLFEHVRMNRPGPAASTVLGFAAGATSGFSGTSGPLKGLALRALGLSRRQLVAAASVVSLAGDTTKVVVFAKAGLLTADWAVWSVAAVPLIAVGVWLGRTFNERMGERIYAWLFWGVMGGYSVRLLATL